MKTQIILSTFLVASLVNAEQSIKGNADFIIEDNFESLTESSFWTSDAWADRSVNCPGSSEYGKSLVFTYAPDRPEEGSSWSEQRFEIPLNAVQIEMEYDLFVPANYVKAPGNHKNFVFWSGTYGMAAGNLALVSESWPTDGGSTPSLSIGLDGNVYGHTMNNNDDILYVNGLGSWINVHVYIELADSEDDFGVFDISKNGNLINGTSHPNVEENWGAPVISQQVSYSSRGNFLKYGYLLGWANGGFSEVTQFCIDNFKFKANSTIKATEGVPEISYRPLLPGVEIQISND
ncbi:hypothetical protein KO489_08910 [Reinekea forsetii]|nr:hypothetical protein [Reinekea forsetii]